MHPLYFFLVLALVGIVLVFGGKAGDEDKVQFLKNGVPVWRTVILNRYRSFSFNISSSTAGAMRSYRMLYAAVVIGMFTLSLRLSS
jgi:hypothetical protein